VICVLVFSFSAMAASAFVIFTVLLPITPAPATGGAGNVACVILFDELFLRPVRLSPVGYV
jgi:hypothetical protein